MKNYFEIFELPQSFLIDEALLEKKYLEFQNQFHPDKSSSADISKSIEVNEGYKILADDFTRACYILQLKGIDILNDERAVKVDMATLAEQLELQEEISEMTDKVEMENLRKNLIVEVKKLISQAMEAQETSHSAQLLVRAKYLKKSIEDLKIRKNKI